VRGQSGATAFARPRQVGQPNVLSDAAAPNRLSTQTARPAAVLIGPAAAGQARASSPARPIGTTAARRGFRISLSTLIFLGFVLLTLFRIIGEMASRVPSETPRATSMAAESVSLVATPGTVTFETASSG
jgi:hypothetical protein